MEKAVKVWYNIKANVYLIIKAALSVEKELTNARKL